MSIRAVIYSLKEGITNLFKNSLMSSASIGTISACLLVVSLFYVIGTNVDHMLERIQTNIGIAVFFQEGTEESRISEIINELDQMDMVHEIIYISPEAAWASFKEDYFDGREALLAGFEGDNPLEDSASLQVFLADIERQGELVTYILEIDGVRHIREDRAITEVIKTFSSLVNYISVVLIGILMLISVFLIANTVRIGIEVRKKQINIMKYIGATDAFIRGPFIVEGALIGVLGAVLPLALVYYFYENATLQIIERFQMLREYLLFVPLDTLMIVLIPVTIATGMIIGVFGSVITIRRHLKV